MVNENLKGREIAVKEAEKIILINSDQEFAKLRNRKNINNAQKRFHEEQSQIREKAINDALNKLSNGKNIENEFNRIKINYIRRIKEIFSKGEFIKSNSNLEFENKISKLLNVKYCCGVANGSDALEVGMLALVIKKGDEVITASNSATIGLRPVYS